MDKMFTRTEINGMALSNRFVRSATWEGLASEKGEITPRLVEVMVDLVRGGVGMIITSHAYVSPDGQAGPWQIGIYEDELIPGLRQMASAVHDNGGKIVLQLSHAGKFAGVQAPLVVSDTEHRGQTKCHEITHQDIGNLVVAFAQGAMRAKAAGFDGVQIHAGHGYLLSQFLSPAFNQRQDQYGGDIHNRARVLLEVYQAIRAAVGADYPVLIKLNCQDFIENGLTLQDSLEVAQMVAQAGIDAIELSGGVITGGRLSPSRRSQKPEMEEPYYLDEAREFKKAMIIPLILVGGIRSFDLSMSLVNGGIADYISMCRPFINDSNLINRWKSGVRCKSECKSDNKCFKSGMTGTGICCALNDEARKFS